MRKKSFSLKFSALSFLLLFVFISHAYADRAIKLKLTGGVSSNRRIALIIGNSAYKSSPLKNPVNDAHDIANRLKRLGFEVSLGKNMTRKEMHNAIRKFGKNLKQGGVGLFYYAGHGMQVQGKNYLIPIGTNIEEEDEVQYESIDASLVLNKMESAGNTMNMVFLDACRNNPFTRSFRSSNKGLAQMDAPSGSLIVYATAPGSVAADGDGRNGVFTKNLLSRIETPGLSLNQMLMKVRVGVRKETSGKQTPWESSSLEGDFYFVPGPGQGKKVSGQGKPGKSSTKSVSYDAESETWEMVKNSTDVEDIKDFLNSFPNGKLYSAARFKLRQLERKKVASLPPQVECCYLTVRSNVSRDIVYIDGVEERGTSMTPFKLDSGRYKIEVKKDGYETYTKVVSLNSSDSDVTDQGGVRTSSSSESAA